MQCRLTSSNILPQIQSRLLTWCKSTCQTVFHPRTHNQSWQQAIVYGMFLYELWKLGALQVVFLPLICSQSKAAVILGQLLREQLSWNPEISRYKACAFGLVFSKPRFVKPARFLSKTAFEFKWKVSWTRMTFGSYFNMTSGHHQAWIRKSFNPAAVRARKVRVLFTLSMRRLASVRSTFASPRIRAWWQLAFPQRKLPAFTRKFREESRGARVPL